MPDYFDEEEYIIPGADFRDAEEKGASGRRNNPAQIQGWRALTMGKTIGKRINIAIPTGETARTPSLNLLEIGGANNDAIEMCITLVNPKFIPANKFPGGIIPPDNTFINNATGERSNQEFLTDDFNAGFQGWIPAVAIIEWGIGGVQSAAEVDWVNGTTVNLTASWVRISAFIDFAPAFVNISTGVVSLQAFVGPGGISRSSAAQRTIAVGPIRETDSALSRPGFPFAGFGPNEATYPVPLFPIPSMAKRASLIAIISNLVLTRSVTDYSVQLTFWTGTSGAVASASRFTNDLREPVPIPNGAAFFTVQNDDAGIDHIIFSCYVIFDLNI